MSEALRSYLDEPVTWLQGHEINDIVLATRVRLARNLSGFVFPENASQVSSGNVEELLRSRIACLQRTHFPDYFRSNDIAKVANEALSERKLVNRKFADPARPRALAVSQDRSFHLTVNSEDHIRMYCTLPGADVRRAWEGLDELDDELAGMLDLAFDVILGFLTSSLKSAGTGLRVSVLLHLPALTMVDHIPQATRALAEADHLLSPFLGRGRLDPALGAMFVVYNRRSIGSTEAEFVADLESVIPMLINYEKKARKMASKESWRLFVSDLTGRALGNLKNAELLEYEEAVGLLSKLRLGAQIGKLPESLGNGLLDLLFELQDSTIRLRNGEELDETTVCNLRSKAVKQWLEAKGV